MVEQGTDEQNGNGTPARLISEEDAKNALLGTQSVVQEENKDPNDKGLGVVKPLAVQKQENLENMAKNIDKETAHLKKQVSNGKLEYRQIFPNTLPSQSEYYEFGRVIEMRPASLEEMTEYATMREEDIYDVEAKVNQILDRCVKITLGERIGGVVTAGSTGSYKDLSQPDKIFVIFAVRDYSLQQHQRENKLSQVLTNPKNGETQKIELTKDSFDYYKLSDNVVKFYNNVEKCFIFTHKDFDSPLKVFVPTVGIVEYVTNYIKEQTETIRSGKNVFLDQHFLGIVQFIVPDWRLLDEDHVYLHKLQEEYKYQWSYDKKMFLGKLISHINLGITNTITAKVGGVDVTERIFFRSYKSIFDISSAASELIPDL